MLRWSRTAVVCCGLAAWLAPTTAKPSALGTLPAQCAGAKHIGLRGSVTLSASEQAWVRQQPPLRVVSVLAPPLSLYHPKEKAYSGVALDVLCFITQQIGLKFELTAGPEKDLPTKLAMLERGEIDLFTPISYLPDRAQFGRFSAPFYDSHYAAITRKNQRMNLRKLSDLQHLRVGYVQGVAIAPTLAALIPQAQLHAYKESVRPGGLFDAVQAGEIDVALFNKDIFTELRYQNELFDLEISFVLHEQPRSYRYFFYPSPSNIRIAQLFDRYLEQIDVSASLQANEVGEQALVARYVEQRSQRNLLMTLSASAGTITLLALVGLHRYRRLSRQLLGQQHEILRQQKALEAANLELEKLSQTDSLTRLANRRQFDEVLAREHAYQQHTGNPLSLLLLDIDHFKQVNDHYGHAIGDDYLRAVAKVLQHTVARIQDLPARYGGEEFVCLLPNTSAADARELAERICASVPRLGLANAGAGSGMLTVSIGVATLESGTHSMQALLSLADSLLYTAKSDGRNQVRCDVLCDAKRP